MESRSEIDGPCTWCGSPDHWRPDCPELRDHVKRVWRGGNEDRGAQMLGLALVALVCSGFWFAAGLLIGKWWL